MMCLTMTKIYIKLIFMCAVVFSVPSYSGTLNNIYVFGEGDQTDSVKCGISSKNIFASAESTLRYNRINIASGNKHDAFLYVNSNAMLISSNLCAISISIEFGKYQPFNVFDKEFFGKTVMCRGGGLFTGNPNNSAREINFRIREHIETCISEIENEFKKIR
jgi:hypothetical protein